MDFGEPCKMSSCFQGFLGSIWLIKEQTQQMMTQTEYWWLALTPSIRHMLEHKHGGILAVIDAIWSFSYSDCITVSAF